MITTKVKYTGEGTKIRPMRMGSKIDVKKGDIFEVEKDNLEFFLKNNCIEVKASQEVVEVEKTTKKAGSKVSKKKK